MVDAREKKTTLLLGMKMKIVLNLKRLVLMPSTRFFPARPSSVNTIYKLFFLRLKDPWSRASIKVGIYTFMHTEATTSDNLLNQNRYKEFFLSKCIGRHALPARSNIEQE